MPCYRPLKAWRSSERGKSGKLGITFDPKKGLRDLPMDIPCGQCIGCRLERSRQWAMRCMCEASLHEENSFITLTYDEENVPVDYGLTKGQGGDFTLFLKRLRKASELPLRYYMCGEYGEENLRPHYHACLFGRDFADKVPLKEGLYMSAELEKLWGLGLCSVGNLTFESAAYVARYCTKVQTGPMSSKNQRIQLDGSVVEVSPPYARMSLRPAVGKEWLKKWKSDAYPSDFLVFRGKKMRPPRYFDKVLEEDDPSLYEEMKRGRLRAKGPHDASNRLIAREQVQKGKAKCFAERKL